MKLRTAIAIAACTAAIAALTSACGSAQATAPHPGAAASLSTTVPLATSVQTADADWAVLPMGGSNPPQDEFWELFVRAPQATNQTTTWKLATPPGVASNGGLVIAATGDKTALAGFRPSQDLKFSPLAATPDAGITWTQSALINPGLARAPDSLAVTTAGALIALADQGQVQHASRLGASWTPMTSRDAIARTPAGRACGLASLTAVAFTAAGKPLLGGDCTRPGTVGLFTLVNDGWQAAGLTLPSGLRQQPVEVLGLSTITGRTTVTLAVGRGAATQIVAAWTGNGVRTWTLSSQLRTGGHPLIAQSLWPNGAVGLVLSGGHAATIRPGKSWQLLPAPPPQTATLALGPGGQLQALAATKTSFTAWQLTAGTAPHWDQIQATKISIPYGSSG
ncbi:MAG TPA: hypothetical protein VEV61_17320 [Streptosporangiaceae bacterium]|nr:hypothetical protein [Streptosporangiaceae bacterium]